MSSEIYTICDIEEFDRSELLGSNWLLMTLVALASNDPALLDVTARFGIKIG